MAVVSDARRFVLVYRLEKDSAFGDPFQDYMGGGSPYGRLRSKS